MTVEGVDLVIKSSRIQALLLLQGYYFVNYTQCKADSADQD